jgi:probable rRNA maturation factor
MAAINFFNQDLPFKLPKPRKTAQWLKSVIRQEKQQLVSLNYIFCSDQYLLDFNQKYLMHETLTDIITFDNSDEQSCIEGDIFISIERVKANALALKIEFEDELHRVMVHGVLHLSGHSDKSKLQKLDMRKKEDAYLSLRNF